MLPSCRSKYHARISGSAIFMISDGWMLPTPGIFNQRRAPFTTSPPTATPSSSTMPMVYSGTAKARDELRRWIGNHNHDATAITTFCDWEMTRPIVSLAALNSTSRPRCRDGGNDGEQERVR